MNTHGFQIPEPRVVIGGDLERCAPHEKSEEDNAYRPAVHLLSAVWCTSDHLRRHGLHETAALVKWRVVAVFELRVHLVLVGKPKVGETNGAIPGEEDAPEADAAVTDADVV